MIKAYKLYTGTDNHSHVTEGSVAEHTFKNVNAISFQESAPYSTYDWHTAPRNQYVITLSGTLEFETFLGEKFIIKPGDILIALDTTGSAHKWRLIDDQPWKRAYVVIENLEDINFIPAQ